MPLPRRDCKPTTCELAVPGLTIERGYRSTTRVQRPCTIFSGISPEKDFAVYNSTMDSMIRAITERVSFVPNDEGGFSPPVIPCSITFNNRMLAVRRSFKRYARYSTPISRSEFCAYYTGRKRAIYEEAAQSLEMEQLCSRDSNLKYFLKAEKVNFTAKPNPAQRLISPRSPRFNVEIGRYLKPIEKQLYNVVTNIFGSITIFKGLNPYQRGKVLWEKWTRFIRPVAVGLDASRFDQHVSRVALEWEHSIYQNYYPGSKYLGRLLSKQLVQKGSAYLHDGRLKFTKEGGRCSGDMNTALGNCLIMCSLVKSYCDGKRIKFELANDGDDCVVIVEEEDLERFNSGLFEWFLQMGFKMKVEPPVTIFEQIDFCQTHPVMVDGEYLMVRDPRVALCKDSISIKPLDNIKLSKSWAQAVSIGGTSLTGGIPIWQEFYQTLGRYAQDAPPLKDDLTMETGFFAMAKGMKRVYKTVSEDTRYSFYLAFDIDSDAQRAIEIAHRSIEIQYRGNGPIRSNLPMQ